MAAAPRAPVVAGAVLSVLALSEAIARGALTDVSTQRALAICVLALSTTIPLMLLGPVWGAAAVSSASVVSLSLFHTMTVAGVASQLIVVYRLGRGAPQTNRLHNTAPLLALPFLVIALVRPSPMSSSAGILTVVLAALAPAAAWAGITRRERDEAMVYSAVRQVIAGTLLEHTARGERARIAHELHDVVAHHISMIAVQAETARLATPDMPALGAERLSAIGDTARAALNEMRRLLGVLREDASTEVGAADGLDRTRQPQPGLEQLNDLLDEARSASGAGARLIVRGPSIALDQGVELAAYRIIQEALTNVRRHAPGAAVDVELVYTDRAVRLSVRDNGPGPSPEHTVGGHGLPGMRERAVAVGGELRAGRAAIGGFLVEAVLPAGPESCP